MFQAKFATAVTCIDGRVQMPVIRYLKNRYALDFVDIISEPGANRLLAEADEHATVEAVLRKVRLSVDRHGARLVAVVGHYDCSGNPSPRELQTVHTREAIARLQNEFLNDMRFVGLWVNERWNVIEVAWWPEGQAWEPLSGRKSAGQPRS